nr:hypothetical protein [Tanacetum cinerariifolium]
MVGGFCWEVMEVHGRISGKWWSGRKNRGEGLVQVGGKIRRSNSRFKRGEEDRGEVWHIYIVSPCGYLRTDLSSLGEKGILAGNAGYGLLELGLGLGI